MRIRPCIDIHDGKVKQVVGSTVDTAAKVTENYVSQMDADYYAGIYRERGLSGGHVILLNSAADKAAYEADCRQAFKALHAFPGGMQAGGGVTPETAEIFLDAGASHVIVTSYVFEKGQLDPARLSRMVGAAGRERLVLDLSCRRRPDGTYAVVTDRWQTFTDLTVCDETLDFLCGHCDEFLIHAADVEGKRAGIEEDLAVLLGAWLRGREKPFPVTYAGGVHTLRDLDRIADCSGGLLDVTVGSALDLFGGQLSLDELEACAQAAGERIAKEVYPVVK
ncbi:MAG: phosphoribosylformimino-5-aminoimidazole carboxamide ribotide isomerase [Lachnospiraceae bacterium]|nr:phosphoribosylformimino-5-aminoimidazole carboxamide ribotide isomerase [Lachnospiraceae bacterium]